MFALFQDNFWTDRIKTADLPKWQRNPHRGGLDGFQNGGSPCRKLFRASKTPFSPKKVGLHRQPVPFKADNPNLPRRGQDHFTPPEAHKKENCSRDRTRCFYSPKCKSPGQEYRKRQMAPSEIWINLELSIPTKTKLFPEGNLGIQTHEIINSVHLFCLKTML